jgi:predicted amidohydrolase
MNLMRAALVVNEVTADPKANLARIITAAEEAAARGAELVLLPETAVTGFVQNDDPGHDLPLGTPIPGAVTRRLGQVTQRLGVHLAIGLLERAGKALYDSAVLLSPEGRTVLRYRRLHPGWHGREANPCVYRQGTTLRSAETPLGRFAFLVCGDLFDDCIIVRARDLQPDWLLLPFARCFNDGSRSQRRWEQRELPHYAARVQRIRCTTLMVNYYSGRELESHFGGAVVVSGSGEVLAHLPLGRPGALVVDLPAPPCSRAITTGG